MSRHSLNNGIHIPETPTRESMTRNLSHEEHLALFRSNIDQTSQSIQSPQVNLIQSPGLRRNENRRSTNSVSSVSHATQATVGTIATETSPFISQVINICNDVDKAANCIATEELVKKCIRNDIWTSNKFLSDLSIKAMKVENRDNPNSVLNILLNFTRKTDLSDLERLKFWKKYSGVVQQDLNNIKTICSRSIKDEIMTGKLVLKYYKFNRQTLTFLFSIKIGLKREHDEYETNTSATSDHNSDGEQENNNTLDDTMIRTLTIRKGPCPKKRKGMIHQLMNMAWNTRKIETVLESDNEDLIYVFYVTCVSRVVRKRKWNQCSQTKKLSAFVDPSDEAFAMLVLENNVSKWMDELRHGRTIGNEGRRKPLYTQGQQGRKWSKSGIIRFIELWKSCNEYRGRNREKKDQYNHIEKMIIRREKIWNDNSSRKRRKICLEDEAIIDEDFEEEQEMERCLQAMANGE